MRHGAFHVGHAAMGGYLLIPQHFGGSWGFIIGFGMAPKLAQMAAGLILDGEDAVPAGFRLDEALVRLSR